MDREQNAASKAIRDGGVVLLFGPGGSGKTHVVRETLRDEGRRCIYAAVATTTATRFGGKNALNTMQLREVIKRYCADQQHPLVATNPTCAHIFGAGGLFRRSERVFIAIDEAGMVSGEHLKQLVNGLWEAAKKHPDPLQRFNRVTWVLLGDPERQLPNISGQPLLKSPVLYDHESGFHRRAVCFTLNGKHRFAPDAREIIDEIEDAFRTNDVDLLKLIVSNRKRAYRAFSAEEMFRIRHFVSTRVEAEEYLREAAAALFGEDAAVMGTAPPADLEDEVRLSSEYAAATYIFPKDSRTRVLLQATVSGQQIRATSCEDPEDYCSVPNRTVFTVDAGAITDLPETYPTRTCTASLSVYHEDADRTIPMFYFDKQGRGRPIFRQLGWVDEDDTIITSVELLYNAQGAQCCGETIAVGSANCRAPITGTTLYVALTRTDDVANVLVHPGLNVTFTTEDWERRREQARLIRLFSTGQHLRPETQVAPQPKRRRLSCLLPKIGA